jgi:hypothetical protein
MEQATPQERIDALRRVHEQEAGGVTPVEELENRRRRRMSTRLGERFGIRTRARDASPSPSPDITGTRSESHSGSTTQVATIPESPDSPTAPEPASSSLPGPSTAGATR